MAYLSDSGVTHLWKRIKNAISHGSPAHNLLDNSDFRNPVNQRGASIYTGEGYTIDRWLIPTSGVTLYKNVDSISATGLFWQYVPAESISNPRAIHTLVFRTKDGRTKILSKAMNVAYSIDDNIGIGFGYDAALQKYIVASGSPDEYIWAALYEGSYTADTLPPYIPKGYGAELAECQRYYVALRSGAERFAGNVTSDGNSWFTIPLPAPMRAQPTLLLHSLGTVASGTEYFTPAAFTGVVGWNGHLILITLSHSASANGAAALCDFNCDLSADL